MMPSASDEPLHALVYVSSALAPLDACQMERMLPPWQKHNARVGVSGVLLVKDGDFLQYLEGPEPALTLLYAHICVDRRHGGLIELLREALARREFADWPMHCFVAPPYFAATRPAMVNQPLRRLLDPAASARSAARLLISSFWYGGCPPAPA